MAVNWGLLRACADLQAELVTIIQCRAVGLTDDAVRWRVNSRRWVRVHSGIYLTKPGRSGIDLAHWAALLRADPGIARIPLGMDHVPQAALSGESAACEWGLLTPAPARVQLIVPARRRVGSWPGVTVLRRRDFDRVMASFGAPRTTLRATILDCAEHGDADAALAWVAKAVQSRRATVDQLRMELSERSRHRHRPLLRECLAVVATGAESTAEVRYIRDVERAHGLPVGLRQLTSVAGRHDNRYPDFRLIVEVDGRLGHERWSDRVRDGRRDRIVAADGTHTTRVFWSDVAITPCMTAVELAAILKVGGWSGAAKPCRAAGCAVETDRGGRQQRGT